MTQETKIRRDTATNMALATPAEGELFYDKTNKRLGVGDGLVAGGIPHLSAADSQKQSFTYSAVGGTANAITLTNAPAVASLTAGLRLTFKAAGTNTTAVTVAVDGLTAKNVKKYLDGAITSLAAGDVVSGAIYEVVYDGTQFQIKGLPMTTPASGAMVYLGTLTANNTSPNLDVGSAMITSAYDDYVFVLDHLVPTLGEGMNVNLSTNNNSSFVTAAYNWAGVQVANGLLSAIGVAAGGTFALVPNTTLISATAVNGGLSGTFKLLGCNNAGTGPSIQFDLAYHNGSTIVSISGGGGLLSASAINSLRFNTTSGGTNWNSGSVKAYGVAKS